MKLDQFPLQLQTCKEEEIDIQCFSEINVDVTKLSIKKKYHDTIRGFDQRAKDIWGNSYLNMTSDYKPGGTGIVTFGSVSGRVKKAGYDKMGRWTYQVFEGGDDKITIIFSIYNCCKNPDTRGKKTAYYQQEIMLSEINRTGNPREYFKRDLIAEIYRLKKIYGENEEVHSTST